MNLFQPIKNWKPSDAIRFPTIEVWGTPLLSVKFTICATNQRLDCVKMNVHPTITVAELTRRLADIRLVSGGHFCKAKSSLIQNNTLDGEMPLWLCGLVIKNKECWIRVE